MTLKMVETVKNYTNIFDFLAKMAHFWTFIKCQKCNGIFKIFGCPFLRKFRDINGTANGTQLVV